ncbi:MAG: hypothetical protein ACTS73_02650 [Arsenophonus sp. NEOnobi-MAG3]
MECNNKDIFPDTQLKGYWVNKTVNVLPSPFHKGMQLKVKAEMWDVSLAGSPRSR